MGKMAGSNSSEIDHEVVAKSFKYSPGGSSPYNLLHWGQIIGSGMFTPFQTHEFYFEDNLIRSYVDEKGLDYKLYEPKARWKYLYHFEEENRNLPVVVINGALSELPVYRLDTKNFQDAMKKTFFFYGPYDGLASAEGVAKLVEDSKIEKSHVVLFKSYDHGSFTSGIHAETEVNALAVRILTTADAPTSVTALDQPPKRFILKKISFPGSVGSLLWSPTVENTNVPAGIEVLSVFLGHEHTVGVDVDELGYPLMRAWGVDSNLGTEDTAYVKVSFDVLKREIPFRVNQNVYQLSLNSMILEEDLDDFLDE